MSIEKKILVSVLALVILIIAGYGLLGSQSNRREGDESGLRSPGVRTIVTLAVVGGSAFITGFEFRDVIGRAVGRRMRNIGFLCRTDMNVGLVQSSSSQL